MRARPDLTRERDVRAAFWRENPKADRRRIPNHSGNGTMHCADTRAAFVDWLDAASREGRITQELAQRVTLG